jgi:hypothetical protein
LVRIFFLTGNYFVAMHKVSPKGVSKTRGKVSAFDFHPKI